MRVAALIRGGLLCRSCSATTCRTEGTADNPIEFECPACSGHGCEKCDDGFVTLLGCPNTFCSSMVPAIDVIDMIGKGHLPVIGGTLDQSASLIQAAQWFEAEEARVKNEQFSRHSD